MEIILNIDKEVFVFKGHLESSKSILNRLFIIKSFFPELMILGDSTSDDVRFMKQSLIAFNGRSKDKICELFCGEAGTTLRFLALRVSREKGQFLLKGSQRLFQRPQNEIKNILDQLQVKCTIRHDSIYIESNGWIIPKKALVVNREESSQFTTAIILSSWGLSENLILNLFPAKKSDTYSDMTIKILKNCGMEINQQVAIEETVNSNQIEIPKNQKINKLKVKAEQDISSVFAIAVLAALVPSNFELINFISDSIQPDISFLNIFKQMNINFEVKGESFFVKQSNNISPISYDLTDTPDLFPVLSVLCSFANGTSILSGLDRLKHKESNRLVKVIELLNDLGISNKLIEDKLFITGPILLKEIKEFTFNPDHDHRMAMACGILKRKGVKINIKTPEVVTKSFPDFWKIIGLKP